MAYTIPPTAQRCGFEALLDASEQATVFMVNYDECFVPEPSVLEDSFFLGGTRFSDFSEQKIFADYVAGVNLIFYVVDATDEVWVLQPLVPLTEF
jgi:hypothetical protein